LRHSLTTVVNWEESRRAFRLLLQPPEDGAANAVRDLERKACTRLPGFLQDRGDGGGTPTGQSNIEKLPTPSRFACKSAMAMAGAVVAKPTPNQFTPQGSWRAPETTWAWLSAVVSVTPPSTFPARAGAR
jgi:hypothetical protein